MYETWHIAAAYAAGTAAGIGIFHQWVKEKIITMTIDSLVEQEYVRSYEDRDGIIHLHKWHELDDIIDRIKEQQEEENDDQDDTP